MNCRFRLATALIGALNVFAANQASFAMEPASAGQVSQVPATSDSEKEGSKDADSIVPYGGFYAGIGIAGSNYGFSNLNSYSQGISKGYSLVYATEYTGAASGSTNTGIPNGFSNVSPAAQIGYFQKFSKSSSWLWGVKGTYALLNSQGQTDGILLVPQSGGYTPPIGAGGGMLNGNVVIRNVTAKINNQFGILPVIGKAYKRGFFYVGGGPTLSQTVIANNGVDGTAIDVQTGRIDSQTDRARYNFSGSGWSVGWQASVGVTYFIDRATFFDLSYTYAQTGYTSIPYSANFRGVDFEDLTLNEGVLSGNTNGRIANQSIILTINRKF